MRISGSPGSVKSAFLKDSQGHSFDAILIDFLAAFSMTFMMVRYAGEYTMDGRQFIIVCGNINYGAVQTFLHDFFHPARSDY